LAAGRSRRRCYNSGKIIFIFANQENLRIFLICFFTGRGRGGKRQIMPALNTNPLPRDYALHRKHFPHTKRLLHQMAQQPLLLQ
jgi:hypothetical protein